MTAPLDDAQVAEWQRLADEATPGPWFDGDVWVYTLPVYADASGLSNVLGDKWYDDDRADAEHQRGLRNAAFIAAAREAVPVLISRLAEVEGEVERLRKFVTVKHGRPSSERDGACICDYNPETTEGPVEDCPFHGRPYAEWIERGDTMKAERDEARAAVGRLADAIEGDDGVAHNDGCEGEPDCLACIVADLRRAALRGEAGEGRS